MQPVNLTIPIVIVFYQVGVLLAAKLLDLAPVDVSCAILAGGFGGAALLLLHSAGVIRPNRRTFERER